MDEKVSDGSYIASYCTEDTAEKHDASLWNKIAYDIDEFKNSAVREGGFYISRYEARDPSAIGSRTDSSSMEITLAFKSELENYNYITQIAAHKLCNEMYKNNEQLYKSDLINSYAWDTTLLFITKFGDAKYPMKTFLDIKKESGDGGIIDKQCNIYDLGTGYFEWTTETWGNSGNPAVCRGAAAFRSNFYVSSRIPKGTTNLREVGFRRNYIY